MRGVDRYWKTSLPYIMPFAAWMGLMAILPPTALSYAARTAATLLIGVVCLAFGSRRCGRPPPGERHCRLGRAVAHVSVGILVGLAVFVLWTALPSWPFAEPDVQSPSPYDPGVCGWPLTVARLVGSSFVIAPVEEVFFRSFLYRRLIARDIRSVPLSRFDMSAFLWTVLLFTLEHNRPIAAAMTGVAYGLLAIRFGLKSAIAAHVTTNLVLAVFVIHKGAWQFW